jgi:hypothetical protein
MDVLTTSTSALVSQVGGRHLTFEFTSAQKRLLQHPYGQLFILYAMFYISTRSMILAAVLIVLYLILVNVLLNENHPLNILSRDWLKKEGFLEKDAPSKSQLYKMNLARLKE